MAKKISFSERFPLAGIFLVIAIALAIPLTTWSLNNVSTQTEQHAATATCTSTYGASCYKYSCPSGYISVSGTCGLMTDSACCTNKLPAATGLNTNITYCSTNNDYLFTFTWNRVPNATSYKVYYKINGSSSYSYRSTTYTSLTLDNQKDLGGKFKSGNYFLWYVRAANGSIYSLSTVMSTQYNSITKSCYPWTTQ